MVKKYKITIKGNQVIVHNTKTKNDTQWDIRNFVYGQMMFNEKTDFFPDYVHAEIWEKYKTY